MEYGIMWGRDVEMTSIFAVLTFWQFSKHLANFATQARAAGIYLYICTYIPPIIQPVIHFFAYIFLTYNFNKFCCTFYLSDTHRSRRQLQIGFPSKVSPLLMAHRTAINSSAMSNWRNWMSIRPVRIGARYPVMRPNSNWSIKLPTWQWEVSKFTNESPYEYAKLCMYISKIYIHIFIPLDLGISGGKLNYFEFKKVYIKAILLQMFQMFIYIFTVNLISQEVNWQSKWCCHDIECVDHPE